MKIIAFLLVAGLLAIGPGNNAFAEIVSRPVLKSFYENGDKPTQAQFAALIDSNLHISLSHGDGVDDHTLHIVDGYIALDAVGAVLAFSEGERIDDLLTFSSIGEHVQVNPLADPLSRYMGVRFEDSGRVNHFGFLQLQVEPSNSSDPYAIHLQHFVYETDSATPISTFFQPVPEPSTAALLTLMAIALAIRTTRSTRHQCY